MTVKTQSARLAQRSRLSVRLVPLASNRVVSGAGRDCICFARRAQPRVTMRQADGIVDQVGRSGKRGTDDQRGIAGRERDGGTHEARKRHAAGGVGTSRSILTASAQPASAKIQKNQEEPWPNPLGPRKKTSLGGSSTSDSGN